MTFQRDPHGYLTAALDDHVVAIDFKSILAASKLDVVLARLQPDCPIGLGADDFDQLATLSDCDLHVLRHRVVHVDY